MTGNGKFVKGQVANPKGRPKGIPNKDTSKFKEALNVLFETNADEMIQWLQEVKDPKDRFAILKDFAEFLYPKLSRAEVTGKDGDAIQIDHRSAKSKLLQMMTDEQLLEAQRLMDE